MVRLQTSRLSGPRTPMLNRLLRDYRDDDAAAVDRLAVAAFEQFSAIYDVRESKIARVWFIFGEPLLLATGASR